MWAHNFNNVMLTYKLSLLTDCSQFCQQGPKLFGKRRHWSAHNDIWQSTQLPCRYHIRQVAAGVAKLVLDAFWTPILRAEEIVGGSAIVPFERAMGVSYRLSIVTVALSITTRMQFEISTGVSHFGAKFWEKWVDRCKQIKFYAIWERHGAVDVVRKRNRVDIFCRLSTMHERDRQTTER